MKFINVLYLMACLMTASLNNVSAFEDDEDTAPKTNDIATQATEIQVINRDIESPLYTLHDTADIDWFTFDALAGTSYTIKTLLVGNDINIALALYDSPTATAEGDEILTANAWPDNSQEEMLWTSPKNGAVYLKVSDATENPTGCRTRMQYKLSVQAPSLGTCGGRLTSQVNYVNANDNGQPLNIKLDGFPDHAKRDPNPEEVDKEQYHLDYSRLGGKLASLSVDKAGFHALQGCHIFMPSRSSVNKNIDLLPEGEALPAPRFNSDLMIADVHDNEIILQVRFDSPETLSAANCIHYYFAVVYPDGRFYMLTDYSTLLPYDNGNELSAWVGKEQNCTTNSQTPEAIKSQDAATLLKLSTENLPKGQYTFYLLQMPFHIADPLNNLEAGRLEMATVEIN